MLIAKVIAGMKIVTFNYSFSALQIQRFNRIVPFISRIKWPSSGILSLFNRRHFVCSRIKATREVTVFNKWEIISFCIFIFYLGCVYRWHCYCFFLTFHSICFQLFDVSVYTEQLKFHCNHVVHTSAPSYTLTINYM